MRVAATPAPPDTGVAMNVVIRSRAELLAWHDELLDRAGMSKDQLYRLAEQWRLRRDERVVYETLRSIDWLLTEDVDIERRGG
jgi:hypothetical protein